MTEEQKKRQTIEWIVTGVAMLVGFYNQIAINQGWIHIQVGDAEVTQYVTWFYELVVGAVAFWRNNNITSPAQLMQVLLNKVKQGLLSTEQIVLLIRVADKLINKEITTEQLEMFVDNNDLKEITQAHLDGYTVEVNIPEED